MRCRGGETISSGAGRGGGGSGGSGGVAKGKKPTGVRSTARRASTSGFPGFHSAEVGAGGHWTTGWGLGGSSNESRLDSSVLVAAKMKEKKEGRATVHWAMNGMSLASSFLDCILPASHLCKGGRPRSTTLDFGHAAAMQFLGGQALPFRWFLCELERVRSRAREGPIVLFQRVSHLQQDTTERPPKDSAVRSHCRQAG